MSETSRTRLDAVRRRFSQGERVCDRWTFYPDGKKPFVVDCWGSGIRFRASRGDIERDCMLVEGRVKLLRDTGPELALVPWSIDTHRRTRSRTGSGPACARRKLSKARQTARARLQRDRAKKESRRGGDPGGLAEGTRRWPREAVPSGTRHDPGE
jgi:hypothetical protein